MPATLHTTAIHLSDVLGPAFGAIVFVLLISLFREPTRKTFNAIFVAGASGVYLSGGVCVWGFLYSAISTRSGENTPELPSRLHILCPLLLLKKKKKKRHSM